MIRPVVLAKWWEVGFSNFCLGLVFFTRMRRGAATRADTFGAMVSWPQPPSSQTSCLYFVVIYLFGIFTGFVVALRIVLSHV